MIKNERIKELAAKLNDYTVESRRKIHRFAEISGTEMKTSAFIREEIEKLGLPYEKLEKTGLVATLDTGREGKRIALRADIDALPLPENPNNLAGPRVCVSENPATCHACGHDAHSAMLLSAMKVLCELKDDLSGIIDFCFEEGEENGGGSFQMVEALKSRKMDGVWAIHVYAALDSGKICVEPGPRMAGAVSVDFTVHGKGGHGSRPDLSINPVYTAAQILPNLACAFENQLNVEETVTLGITSIQGGTTGNVIPETARVLGSFRFFNIEEGKKSVEILKKVCEHTAAMNNCTVTYAPKTGIAVVPVMTDATCSELATEALNEILPEGTVAHCDKWYASESFSRIAAIFPSVFAFLGIRNPEYGSGATHHNEYFDVDENVLPIGLLSTVKYVVRFLGEQ
ncbi:MAG: amidohydrolase [Lachnospiraceae bacterium]|nr:amidohydrolase [Lachnospiraceae bacterium]